MLLTSGQLADFERDGYLHVKNLFSLDEIERLKTIYARMQNVAQQMETPQNYAGSYFVVEGKKIHRIVWCAGVEPQLLSISDDERLILPAAQILGSCQLNQLICQAHFKIPGDGVIFPMHQDSENRGYGTADWKDVNGGGSYLQTVLALDPMTEENSPILVWPGSHKQGHVYLEKNENRQQYVDETKIRMACMEPGDLLMFGPYFIHGSGENNSTKPRRILINGYAYPGANRRIYPGCGLGRRIDIPSKWQQKLENLDSAIFGVRKVG
ncbi:MAG: phytanoyl-CoA dioxygenase family protein [Oligoflexales bacterium]|nr:phytanoyl-CoA dioxygenase family protein [Oligoflexales bacterium]